MFDADTLDTLATFTIAGNPTCADVCSDSASIVIGTLTGDVVKLNLERYTDVQQEKEAQSTISFSGKSVSVSALHPIVKIRLLNLVGEIIEESSTNTIELPAYGGYFLLVTEDVRGFITTHKISSY